MSISNQNLTIMRAFIHLALFVTSLSFTLFSCGDNSGSKGKSFNLNPNKDIQVFELADSKESGIVFKNSISESQELNYFLYEEMYEGAGLAVIDINNDGLQDVFFAGNMVNDKLYLNKGNLKFEDITYKSRISQERGWSTGVAVADVNNDGWKDIYVSRFLHDDAQLRKNLLYINNGDLTFTESAQKYGIADVGYAIQSNFFDYDKDGYVDLYIAHQPPTNGASKRALKGKKHFGYTDRLYKNNGNGTFTDVTDKAGITNYTFSLSTTVSDLNNDGWLDIYVASDYDEPDYYFQNNGDGTFTNIIDDALKHISYFSMGVDIADINNDGWLDIYSADMVADDNRRLKTNMSGMNPEKFYSLSKNGYHYQYMFNALQLNNGNGTFSEIAQLSGVSNTDWSWAPLFVDFDNDGHKDLMVSNGLLRDMRNNDFHKKTKEFAAAQKAKGQVIDLVQVSNSAPSEKLNNFIYKNNGDLTFTKKIKDWGFDKKSWSNGAAYADFDNDGDMDIIMNNVNEEAFLYVNKSSDLQINNYLQVEITPSKSFANPVGTRVKVYTGDLVQLQELSPIRGYMSTSQPILHFGVGEAATVDMVEIIYLDGRVESLKDVAVNQVLKVDPSKAIAQQTSVPNNSTLFTDITSKSDLGFRHSENDYDDFKEEILLPHRMSHLGPCLATGDINGDGLEDFFVGGAAESPGAIFIQKSGADFEPVNSNTLLADKAHEDLGALFFDADGDEDLDLYVVSGGNDFSPGSSKFQDRLYINNGKGKFTKSNGLPTIRVSGSKVAAGDYDGDGDLDLFVSGRQVPGKYGYPTSSIILENNKGRFKDATTKVAAELKDIGMVSDAVWNDFDKDGDLDLIAVGEWMPITFFQNENGKLKNITKEINLPPNNGWWNSIDQADLDGDGNLDFILGNLGLNLKYKASEEEPFKLFVKDFDGNGTNDVYLGYYDHDGVCYPVRGRECSSQQLNFIKSDFPTYELFAAAPIEEVLGERKDGALMHEVQLFESIVLFNKGSLNFEIKALPNHAQTSPIFGAVSHDWNNDGQNDLFVAGNYYHREVETTRSDAGIGQVLMNDGGEFKAIHPTQTGIIASEDVRAVDMVKDSQGKPIIIIANNSGPIQLYRFNKGEVN